MTTDNVNLSLQASSAKRTMELARMLAGALKPGDWIGLTGDLGAGKTCFSKGLALGLGVDENIPVTSPTFTILQTYHGRMMCLNHLDLYRLGNYSELVEIGYEELLEDRCVLSVEWCDKFPEAMGADGIVINFELVDEKIRNLSFEALGPRGRELIESVRDFD